MQTYGSIGKGISKHDTKHQISICESYSHKKLKEDIPKIKQSPNVSVFTDKTGNTYEMPEQKHKQLLHDNVTKTYKKVPPKLEAKLRSKKHCRAH